MIDGLSGECGELYADLQNGGAPNVCKLPRCHKGIPHGAPTSSLQSVQSAGEKNKVFDEFMMSIMNDIGRDVHGKPLEAKPADTSSIPAVRMLGG